MLQNPIVLVTNVEIGSIFDEGTMSIGVVAVVVSVS